MKNAVMPLEQAVNEINGWLDYKRIEESDRATYSEQINKLADKIAKGVLSIDQDKIMTMCLAFPVEVAGTPVETIAIKPRVTTKEVKDKSMNVRAGDADGRLLAYVAASTGLQQQVIDKLDMLDFNLLNIIMVFFMV